MTQYNEVQKSEVLTRSRYTGYYHDIPERRSKEIRHEHKRLQIPTTVSNGGYIPR